MHALFDHHASPRNCGHIGWNGTATAIDLQYRLGIVLLTDKKNTPVADPGANPNRFVGDAFAIADYGPVIDAIHEALLPTAP